MGTVLALFWIAVVLYGISALFYVLSFKHKKERFIRRGVFFAGLGFIPHTLCIAFYWTRPAYLSFSTFQIINDAAWSGVLVFLLTMWAAKFVRPAGILTMPITVFLQVWAAVSKKEIGMTPAEYDTAWFWVHVISSAIAYGFVMIGGAVGLLYILKTRHPGEPFYDSLPDFNKLDNSNYFFIGIGFVMLTLMIISGSLWTKKVHGSYWGWDPLEVQSLIAWIGYAIWLHMRLTFGWRGKRLAWYSILALPLMVILIWGIPLVPGMFHRGFRVTHF